MKKHKANRLDLSKHSTKTTDYTSNANSRHMIHGDFEHLQDSNSDMTQYILTTGSSENRLKDFLKAKLERDCQALLDEFSWMDKNAKKA